MPDTRVAVYIDFDNVVISRYDQVHDGKRDSWRSDNARDHKAQADSDDPIAVKLAEATVDVGALLDYASSFGTVALSRAYADWSVPANAAYRRQLVDRAVDLIQLFPVSGTKNGADIRLSVDAMEDLMQYADLTHVVIVGGDSDYIALAQRCKQLGRFVVGIGVAGSTSRALIAACDEFSSYDALPGVPPPPKKEAEQEPEQDSKPAKKTAAKKTAAKKTTAKKTAAKKTAAGRAAASEEDAETAPAEDATAEAGDDESVGAAEPPPPSAPTTRTTTRRRGQRAVEAKEPDPKREGEELLVRAMRVAQDKGDGEWLYGGGVKSQMQRMDPSFKEKSLGFKSFSAFIESLEGTVETRTDTDGHLRLRLV